MGAVYSLPGRESGGRLLSLQEEVSLRPFEKGVEGR